jgi:tetratricopeptide (TPR) repeat protein
VGEERRLQAEAAQQPKSASAAGALGTFYFHEKRWQQSAHWLERAYELSNGDASIGVDLALAWMQAGDLILAQRQVARMQDLNETAQLHGLMAEILDRRGAYQDAAQEYHHAAELEPSEEHIFDLATYLLQHKQYVGALDDAIKFFRYGVQQFPRSGRMRVGLGVGLYAANEYDEAVRVLCEAVDLDPTDTRPLQFLGRASRVSPDLAQGVDARLKQFAERYPENAAANYFYALALWERGGGAEGKGLQAIERLLRKAKGLDPGWYEPHYQLGVVFESEGKYAEALAEIKKAVAIDEEFYPGHYRLARLYSRAGQGSQAIAEAALVKRLKATGDGTPNTHDVTE